MGERTSDEAEKKERPPRRSKRSIQSSDILHWEAMDIKGDEGVSCNQRKKKEEIHSAVKELRLLSKGGCYTWGEERGGDAD